MLLKTPFRALDLWRQLLLPCPFPGIWRYLYRLALGVLLLPLFVAAQCLHWLGFAVDELLFRGYRKVEVRHPVFVLGVPRSGTTRSHRLLAEDPRFTTFSTWECLFAPSISERYAIRAAAALDRRLGAPLHVLVGWLERRVAGALDEVHPISLAAPEEDYLALLPVLCCFVLVIPFPQANWLWRLARFDRDLPATEQRRFIAGYRRCLQRHLFVHGPDKTLLSKNASFAGMAHSLARAFPDSRIVVCERDALQVIGSQFNALAGARRLCGLAADEPRFRDQLLASLEFYYRNLDTLKRELPASRCFVLAAADLARAPEEQRARLYRQLGLGAPPVSATPSGPSASAGAAAGIHRPVAQPPLARWGLQASELRRRFGPWCRAEARL
ncbi:sulfotransferase [Parahaliea mediterranea]|uniref:Sulfotransferase n=1 Tax=Parahaliea mediterranea TaxID=651086 RepID=A0A939DG19_9GAMM|nr:sulfotransferase [Parahaliea mediterranea]MBN7796842.1 sulfotransferase [Parahaliea mediterranea]